MKMTARSWLGVLSLAAIAVLLRVGSAIAAADHGGEHAPSVSDLFFPTVNALLFLYILRRTGGGAIRDFLQQRRTQIMEALDTATAAKREAGLAHAEVHGRLEGLEAEVAQLRAEMRSVVDNERERRHSLMADVASRTTRDARLIADQEVRAAQEQIREETVNAAVAETMAILRRQVKTPDQERFVRDFLGAVQTQV